MEEVEVNGTAAAAHSLRLSSNNNGQNCSYTTRRREDGGLVRALDPGCFYNPLLNVHSLATGWSPAFCRQLRLAAERVDEWSDSSSFPFDGANPKSDVSLERLQHVLSEEDLDTLTAFVHRLAAFIEENFVVKLPELDGQQMRVKGSSTPLHPAGKWPYNEAVQIKGAPFLIKYDAGAGGGASLPWHKDNADGARR